MRMILIALAAVATLVTGGVPASAAGGWAVTYLDAHTSRFEAGTSYTVGFWVLQHGTHPFEGSLGAVGLRLTRDDGESALFDGTALPEAGHYVTSVVVPKGVWKVEGVQGLFRPYEVGTLTVPGGLKVNPVPPDLVAAISEGVKDYWGDVRPPGFPRGEPATVAAAPPATSAPVTAFPAAGQAAVAAGRDDGGVPAYTLVFAALGGALLAVVGLRLPPLARGKKDEPEPSGADTIVISG
ncbi:hypothetical protein [Nonomuraea sp. NPDC050643]|uniref:hypothetical protein n=1 Tax=Nonomuraea sp. NPDC050643 TaxID=3155660 RepID=UPI0033DCCFC8